MPPNHPQAPDAAECAAVNALILAAYHGKASRPFLERWILREYGALERARWAVATPPGVA